MKKNGFHFLFFVVLCSTIFTISCTDDEPEEISYTTSISSTTTSLNENGGSAVITVELDNANQGDDIPFTLNFSGTATLDEDYSVSTGMSIPSGSSSISITITAINDEEVEEDESITLTISFDPSTNVTIGGGGRTVDLTITDDDEPAPPTFNASITSSTSSLAENAGTASFTVELDQANQGTNAIPFNLSFSGSGTLDQDYSVSTESREIASGTSSTSFTITAIDDSDVEGDETITVTLSFPNDQVTVSDGEVSFTITDDDTATGACAGTTDSYSIDLDASNCSENIETNLGVSSVYTVTVSGGSRTIVSNSIPDHNVGVFPGMGNPHTISVQEKTFTIDANPTKNNSVTGLTTSNGQPRYWFGILDNSIVLAPIANEFFTNTSTGEDNRDWNESALSSNINLGTDCNNSHVFPTGRYHHHATPSAYVADRNISSSTTTQVGWAADGFPIYYKYANKDGSVVAVTSSFRLKTTERGGDGVSAPGGCPDGTYNEDYEYVAGLGDLDECNGYEDPTLGYIYVITDTYPSIPRCFAGTPSSDFENN